MHTLPLYLMESFTSPVVPTLSTFHCVDTNSDLFHCICLQFVTSWHLSPLSPVIRTDLSVLAAMLEMEPQEVRERERERETEFECLFIFACSCV